MCNSLHLSTVETKAEHFYLYYQKLTSSLFMKFWEWCSMVWCQTNSKKLLFIRGVVAAYDITHEKSDTGSICIALIRMLHSVLYPHVCRAQSVFPTSLKSVACWAFLTITLPPTIKYIPFRVCDKPVTHKRLKYARNFQSWKIGSDD